MSARNQFRRCVGARAAALLRAGRDTLELAARAPGDRVEISRQDADSMLNDFRVIEKILREMEEDGRE